MTGHEATPLRGHAAAWKPPRTRLARVLATMVCIAAPPLATPTPVVARQLPAWCAVGQPVLAVGSLQGPAGHELDGVTGAHRDRYGGLVVANGGSHELRFFDSSGRFRHSIGGAGDGPGEFRGLMLLRGFAGDSLLAYDGRQARATVLGPDGQVARTFRMPPSTGFVVIDDVFEDGRSVARVLVGYRSEETSSGVHRTSIRILELSPSGEISRDLGEFPGDESYALASFGGMIVGPLVFGASLHAAALDGAALGGDRIVIGASDDARLRFARRTGEGAVPHGFARRPSTEGAFRRAREEYLEDFPDDARAIEARRFDDMPRVELLPFFAELRADDAGNVWVRHYSVPGDPTRAWTVFDGSGRPVANARTPDGARVLEIGHDHVIVVLTDELGVERVQVVPLRREGCPD